MIILFLLFVFGLPVANIILIISGLVMRKVNWLHAFLIMGTIITVPFLMSEFGPGSTEFSRGAANELNGDAVLAAFFICNIISLIFLLVKIFSTPEEKLETIDHT